MNKKYILILIPTLLLACRSTMFKCAEENKCSNNQGKYVSTTDFKDSYEGNTKVSPVFNFWVERILPFGYGKIIYKQDQPGYIRKESQLDSYDGEWNWVLDNARVDYLSVYHGLGKLYIKDGSIIETEWDKGNHKVGSAGKITFKDGRSISGTWNKFFLCSGNCINGNGSWSSGYGSWIQSGIFTDGSLNGFGTEETNEYIFKGIFTKSAKTSGKVKCKVEKPECLKSIPKGFHSILEFE
ncbi:hypothetical protein EHQ68_13845 [Leptospira congkakensis]|uniref:Uncharacterized protein n=1 Tax=Leptospira congkakensis TaxID=2484932 RepID=A0A4Z1A610_9LEPT|nr:hypothetical protein [Leptospira congkakensis]TGL86400.1 hypothetical protein EHQ68_13845 [Leptospira congkakensis]TGL94054.1 hypothetical protein EHQ69_06185 [Leptospira congkakensis]TGL94540.1 hypothetical protein EHQ70_14610 [Leptospira congkakensis]